MGNIIMYLFYMVIFSAFLMGCTFYILMFIDDAIHIIIKNKKEEKRNENKTRK